MKKKFLTLAMAAVMTVASAVNAFAAEYYTNEWKNETNDAYTEVENPLKGKNLEKVVITYKINWTADAARNGWDGIFSFYDASTNYRVSFQTAPYLCFNAKTDADDRWVDLKADGWCTANCEPGKDYTFQYIITKDAVTVSCDGKAIAEFAEVGKGGTYAGPQDILDALNTYPTLTLGVGLAKSAYWNTELSTVNLVISDTEVAEDESQAPTTAAPEGDTTTAAPETTTPADKAPETGDASNSVVLLAVAAAAVAGVVVLKKKTVTE